MYKTIICFQLKYNEIYKNVVINDYNIMFVKYSLNIYDNPHKKKLFLSTFYQSIFIVRYKLINLS